MSRAARKPSIASRPASLLACSAAAFGVVAAMGLWGDRETPRAIGAESVAPVRTAAAAAADAPPPANESPALPRDYVPAIERALVSADAGQRQTALDTLLPELLASEPAKAVALFARLSPGDTREALREEMARTWVRRDRETALAWIESLADEAERKSAALVAVRSLAAGAPAQALAAAGRFDVGQGDGSVEHIAQIWANDDPDAVRRWLASEPDGRYASTRDRVRQVLAQGNGAP